ncbi:SymE family type I addiction module toxin [Burkholderia sp. FL-7-2-10-S1-D7]|uniref:SymE family type I addiction module toxin n=1 Tax=Burkholderia sp. FL-7-2-10-S1-D7 TaxID=1637866 RepID=UPI0009EA75F9|nr:SymE family type I addiction module toxin [Burkholderia sp. FL-7-2-10-S1-D7]
MADANLKARPPVTERFITMQHKRDIGRYGIRAIHDESCEPLWLKIAGRWLTHDVGFHAGQKLLVHVEHGKLTITAAQIAPAVTQAEQIAISPDHHQPR